MGLDRSVADIVEHVHEAMERLHRQMTRVELWAGALRGFAQPVPDYEPSQAYLMKPFGDEMDYLGHAARSQVIPAGAA